MMALPIHIAFDGLSGVDGSARFAFGTTTAALASVSGPIAPRLAAEHPVRATVDVHVRPLAAVPGTPEKHTAAALKGILERACVLAQHPRTSVQVVVQALAANDTDGDGDVRLAAQINAASLALLSAGSVPMRGVVCAVAVAQAQLASAAATQPQLVADPGRDRPAYTGCFAFLFGVDAGDDGSTPIPPSKMVWTNYRARPGHAFSATALAQAEIVALDGATGVWVKMKESLGAFSCAGDGRSHAL